MFLIFQERKERGKFVKKKGGVDVIWYNVKYTWILLLIMPKDKEETFQLSKNIFVVKMLMPSHCRFFFLWAPTSFSFSLVKIYIKNWNGVKNKKWKWYITIYCTCTIHFFFQFMWYTMVYEVERGKNICITWFDMLICFIWLKYLNSRYC